MQRALSALLRDFGATSRRVGDPGAQQRADSLWERIEPRLSNRAAILLSNARYIARRDHLKSIGGEDYAKVVGESIQHLESVVAAAVRRAEVGGGPPTTADRTTGVAAGSPRNRVWLRWGSW